MKQPRFKTYEQFLNESESMDMDITDYIKYPGMKFQDDGMGISFSVDGKYAGEFRFAGIEDFEGIDYVVSEMIVVEPEFKRKGIYSAIIQGAIDWCKETGEAEGVVSFQFDLDSGEAERSKEANAFWEGWVSKGKATKVENYFDGEEETTVYHTTRKVQEDAGMATLASTPGMGNPVAPTSNSEGSGDLWPTLSSVGSGTKKKKRKKKKKTK